MQVTKEIDHEKIQVTEDKGIYLLLTQYYCGIQAKKDLETIMLSKN